MLYLKVSISLTQMVPLPHTYPARAGIVLTRISSKCTAFCFSKRAWHQKQVNPLLPTHPVLSPPFYEVRVSGSALLSAPGGQIGHWESPQALYLAQNTPGLYVGFTTSLMAEEAIIAQFLSSSFLFSFSVVSPSSLENCGLSWTTLSKWASDGQF